METALSIIIADDHPVFRSGMEFSLKSMGKKFNISHASDGQQVIHLLKKQHYDIVFMDIRMEPMSGIEAVEIIKDQFPETRIIVLSMYDDEKTVIRLNDLGVDGYLLKNADRRELEEAIESVMAGRNYFTKQISEILIEQLKKLRSLKESNSVTNWLDHPRYREIAFLITHELKNEEIAEALYLSSRTVEFYRRKILEITGCKSSIGLVKLVLKLGLDTAPDLHERFSEFLIIDPTNKRK